jgi:hypothetical protein
MNVTICRLFHMFWYAALDAYKNHSERALFIEDVVCKKAAEAGSV